MARSSAAKKALKKNAVASFQKKTIKKTAVVKNVIEKKVVATVQKTGQKTVVAVKTPKVVAKPIKKRQQKGSEYRMQIRTPTRSLASKKEVRTKMIRQVLRRRNTQLVKGTTNVVMTVKDVRNTISKGQMLNDNHINILLTNMCKNKAAIVNSLWMQCAWKFEAILDIIRTSELVIIPIHFASHWSVMLMNYKVNLAVFCDSITMRNDKSYHEEVATSFVTKVEAALRTRIEFFKLPVRQQLDGVSCGVHVIRNTEKLLKGTKYWDMDDDIHSFRFDYAERLLFGEIEDEVVPKVEYLKKQPKQKKTMTKEEEDDDISIIEEIKKEEVLPSVPVQQKKVEVKKEDDDEIEFLGIVSRAVLQSQPVVRNVIQVNQCDDDDCTIIEPEDKPIVKVESQIDEIVIE